MTSIIALTQSNVVNDGTNSNLTYQFPNGWTAKQMEVAIASVTMYNACNNISPIYNNQSFTYSWYFSGVRVYYRVTLPIGMYQIADINNYWQSVMMENGHYLLNSSGQAVYYCEMVTSITNYSVNINTYPVPTALPAGYSTPSNFTGFPMFNFNPQVILDTSINTVLGYTANFSTDENVGVDTILSYSSSVSPQITSNPTFFLASNLIMNRLQTPSTIMGSMTPNVAMGYAYRYEPSTLLWLPVSDGQYNNITVSILGSNRSQITLLDPNITIVLAVRQRGS